MASKRGRVEYRYPVKVSCDLRCKIVANGSNNLYNKGVEIKAKTYQKFTLFSKQMIPRP
jgi:hypothetical protein